MVLILAIILAITVEGNQRIVQVSEIISDNILPYDEGDDNFTCCNFGDCSCHSFDFAVSHLTSSVMINIITNVTLSSLIKVSNLESVSIIGYNNPTVYCKNIGGIHFIFCHNCIFEGITWDRCGSNYVNHNDNTEAGPGLKLSYSLNIMIQNCLFQHSAGQIVVLLISKNVTINHCKFFNNQGVCVYAVNQKVYFNGKILFQNNTAKHGSGIYISDHSTVIFNENSDVTFVKNSAIKGGAVFLRDNSSISFDHNSTVLFIGNNADYGTIYSEGSSKVTFKASCKVAFNNSSANFGSAIYSFKLHIWETQL